MTRTSMQAGARSYGSGPGLDDKTARAAEPTAVPAGEGTTPGVRVIGQGRNAAGLALRVDARDGRDFEIAVVDAEGRTLLPLGPYGEDEVIATWRGLGASSGLELMIARLDGSLERPYPQVGRVQLGRIRVRRRSGCHGARRPRFLVRRKTGCLPLRPEVHRGECAFGTGPAT